MKNTTYTTIENVKIKNARAYEPMHNRDTGAAYYPVFFDTFATDVQGETALAYMGRYRNNHGNFLLTNICKPVVTVEGDDYGALIDDLEVLRVRNLPPDMVFDDRIADLVVATEEQSNGEKRHTLSEIILKG